MRNSQIITLLLLGTIFTISMVLTLISLGIMSGPTVAAVSDVPTGSQEIAFLAPATSVDTWERLVEAMEQIKQHWPDYHKGMKPLDFDAREAFPHQSAAVPQFAVWLGSAGNERLLVRWYKISGEKTIDDWIEALASRTPPPLAIIGGDNTRRAEEISIALQNQRGRWHGSDPLFLITTATKDNLMKLYQDRNFRFSFPNRAMTRTVLDFIGEHPELLWPRYQFDFRMAAAMFGAGDGLTSAALLHAEQRWLNYAIFGVAWKDDAYSEDLCNGFLQEFRHRYYPLVEKDLFLDQSPKLRVYNDVIPYSTGDFLNPNPEEIGAALRFFETWEDSRTLRQLLVLPTGADRAKRFLRTVINSNPKVVKNLVVVSGDSITFNQIYRDRKFSWNILDVPVPLVFFSHRNPVYSGKGGENDLMGFVKEGTGNRPWATTGTQDLLLHRDILEAVIVAAYRQGPPVSDADELDRRLLKLQWISVEDSEGRAIDGYVGFGPNGNPLFDSKRNRHEGTGEHVILLVPQRDETALLQPQADIEVWPRKTVAGICQGWARPVILADVPYAEPRTPLADEH